MFHLAGIIHPSRKTKELFEINVQGAKNILEAAIRSRVKRFVVISSNSPAGTNPHKDHLFTEDTPYNPHMLYGRSKMEMEILVDNTFRRGDIETVILRPCWFYGPGRPLRQTLFFSMIKNGSAPIVEEESANDPCPGGPTPAKSCFWLPVTHRPTASYFDCGQRRTR